MTARTVLYVGLVNYAQADTNAINCYTYHQPRKTALEGDDIGYADDVVSFALKAGQKPSEGLVEALKSQRPQYRGKLNESIFATFITDKEPKFQKIDTRQPAHNAAVVPPS